MDFQENQIVENRFEVDGVLLRERREQKTHALRSGAKSMRIITRFIGDKKYEWKQMDNENPSQIYSYSKKKTAKGGIAKFEKMWEEKLREYSNFSGIFFI